MAHNVRNHAVGTSLTMDNARQHELSPRPVRSRVPGHVRRFHREEIRVTANEQPAAPRYSLLLFFLVCILASMLVAWIGITRQPIGNAGFRASGPRPLAFVEPGELVHQVSRDVIHGPTGVSARLTVRIELNHDRVLSQSIENCLADIEHYGYSVHGSLSSGDFTFIEDYVSGRINGVNGRSATKSVSLTNVQTITSP